MISMKKILCPIDFSPFSQKALHYAMALAKQHKATLYVQHVAETIPYPYYSGYGADIPILQNQDLQKQLRQRAQQALEDFIPAEAKQELALVPVLSEGTPYREILTLAEKEQIDMLLMGTHGRTGLEKLFLGSVTEKVMRKAPCPVLTVCHTGKEKEGIIRFDRIVLPIDFSEHSIKQLEYGLALAEDYKSQLYVLHVVEEGFTEYANDRIRGAEKKIANIIPENAKCKIETAVRTGTAHKEILSVAGETDADLIILGVSGRGALGAALFGSTTYRVVRSAERPVLAVK